MKSCITIVVAMLYINILSAQTTPAEVTAKGIYSDNKELKKRVNSEVVHLNQAISSLSKEMEVLHGKIKSEKNQTSKDSLNDVMQGLIVQRGAFILKTRQILAHYNNIMKDSINLYVQRTPSGDFLLYTE